MTIIAENNKREVQKKVTYPIIVDRLQPALQLAAGHRQSYGRNIDARRPSHSRHEIPRNSHLLAEAYLEPGQIKPLQDKAGSDEPVQSKTS